MTVTPRITSIDVAASQMVRLLFFCAVAPWLSPAGFAQEPHASLEMLFEDHPLPRPVDAHPFASGWLVATQKAAEVVYLQPGQEATVVADMSGVIGGRGNEEGLLAIEPTTNPAGLLVYGSRQNPRRTVLSWLPLDTERNVFLVADEKIILEQAQFASNHNGGDILPLPDGSFLLGFGDGGRAGDPKRHGQNRRTWLGSLIRIRIDFAQGTYTVPEDNPFAGDSSAAPEVWAYGLRNPWRTDIGPAGRIWIGDVGQNKWEEITIATPGSNHGWRSYEGHEVFKRGEEPITPVVAPAFVYGHNDRGGYSVTGGVFDRNPESPLFGAYIFGDYATGRYWYCLPDAEGNPGEFKELLRQPTSHPASFANDAQGNVVVVSHRGHLWRVRYDAGE